jgi:hypothetical protein
MPFKKMPDETSITGIDFKSLLLVTMLHAANLPNGVWYFLKHQRDVEVVYYRDSVTLVNRWSKG